MQYHIVTFHKAGSTWMRRIFRGVADYKQMSIRAHKVNRFALNSNIDRDSPDTMHLYRGPGSYFNFKKIGDSDARPVLCIRDPKDGLISQYYSWLKTHLQNTDTILEYRERLANMTQEDGLKALIEDNVVAMANVLRTWLPMIRDDRVILLRYEDMLADFDATLSNVLKQIGIDVPADVVAELKDAYSFKALTNREPGQEDTSQHIRKGVAGDWKNHFNADIARAFDAQFGDLCDALGYGRATAEF